MWSYLSSVALRCVRKSRYPTRDVHQRPLRVREYALARLARDGSHLGSFDSKKFLPDNGRLGACGRGCDPVDLDNLQSSVKGTYARPAYGAGLQIRLGSFALRTTYERISVNTGDPDLLSLGVSWLF
jgi:hypothetical protein